MTSFTLQREAFLLNIQFYTPGPLMDRISPTSEMPPQCLSYHPGELDCFYKNNSILLIATTSYTNFNVHFLFVCLFLQKITFSHLSALFCVPDAH